MKISIAMAVYNGERFIREQLASFLQQTILPDELVVSDNASTDRTVEIVREFAARAPFPVRLYINERNLGVSKNFERAIRECSGDIIFPSDCDDVWYPSKLATMEHAIACSPTAAIALCDADLVDETLGSQGVRLWQTFRFSPGPRLRSKMAVGRGFKRSVPTFGNCMAFRATLKAIVLPMPDGDLFERTAHDAFIAWTAVYSGFGGVACIAEPLLAYRQHTDQMTVVEDLCITGRLSRFLAQRKETPWSPFLAAVAERLEEIPDSIRPINLDIRNAVLLHWQARTHLPAAKIKRLLPVTHELLTGRYHRYSSGLRTAIKDLVFVE